jgi:subfamily B ATP-binding cassette protein MsbA
MHNFGVVFRFGWVYLRRYWVRIAAAVLMGVVFGFTNASFVWATKTLIERFRPHDPVSQTTQVQTNSTPQTGVSVAEAEPNVKPDAASKTNGPVSAISSYFSGLKAYGKALKEKADRGVDTWLPRLGRELDWRQMLGGILFLPLLVSIRGTADFLSAYCMGWASERMINDMRLDVLKKKLSLSMDFFNSTTSGDLLTRVNADTQRLLRCLRTGASDLVKESISLLSVLCVLVAMNWKLTFFAIVLVPACLFPLFILARKVRKAARAGVRSEVLQTSQLVELLQSIRIIKAFNLEGAQVERYRRVSKDMVRRNMGALKAKEMVNPFIEVISMIGIGLMILFVFKTGTSISDFAGFMVGLILFFQPIKKLAGVHMLFEQATPGVERLIDFLNEEPTVKEPLNPKPLSGFKSEVRFEQVTFSYGDRVVIRDFDLVIPAGARVGLAGPSGSGKSTLVNLLFRFYDPVSGVIKIDGLDLREVSSKDLRQQLALVSQDVVIFDTSVAENIACGRTGATPAEIENAARAAYAHEFIEMLPQGYKTRLGERGVKLSGGQRQRIAIARAFIRNAPIMVLDEATASLDSQAEAEVQRALDHVSENRTVISVAHRLSTLSSCDQVIVLVEGQIVEQGSYNELLRAGGIFAAMAGRQGIVSGHTASVPALEPLET